MLVLPSSPLITPFSAEENNIESCDVRWETLCVYVHSESSTDERFLWKQKIFTQVKLKGRRFCRLGYCFCLLFAGGAGIFLLSFWHRSMVRSDQLIENEKHKWNSSEFFLLIDLFRKISVWGLEENLPSETRHGSELYCKKATIKALPLPFLPMTSCDLSISCESFVIRRERAAIPVRPLFCGTRCVLSANHRWSVTSVQGCFVKAVIVRWQKDGRENAIAKEHFTGRSGGQIKIQIKHTSYEDQYSYFCGSLGEMGMNVWECVWGEVALWNTVSWISCCVVFHRSSVLIP